MPGMDVFNSDAFSMVTLTSAVEKVPYQPMMLGDMGIFAEAPSRTTTVMIEERKGVLSLVPTSPRGAPPEQRHTEKRKVHLVSVPRIAKGDRIMADELQNIRAFGSETELMAVQAEVARRLAGPTGILRDVELTWEHMRLGAVQGEVLDADGSTIINWYTLFGITPAPEEPFNFAAAQPGDIRKTCTKIVRQMMRAAKGGWSSLTRVVALAGDDFWDQFTAHEEVRETFKNWSAATDLRSGLAYETFDYGGISWLNYRGTDDGTTVSVPTDEAKFFPSQAPGVFQVAYAPVEKMEFVNTLGLSRYSAIVPDRDRDMWADVEVYSNPLFICTRPAMLQSGRAGA